MTTNRKLGDPQVVVQALNQYPTITATAIALGVSRQRLTKYMRGRIRKECTYLAIEQYTSIRAVTSDAPEPPDGER